MSATYPDPLLEQVTEMPFAFFAKKGETVVDPDNPGTGDVIIGPTLGGRPDTQAMWAQCSLGCVTNVSREIDTEDETLNCPTATRWQRRTKTRVLADLMNFSLVALTQHLYELMYGLQETPVRGTAQSPFATSQRELEGWFNYQGRAEEDSLDRVQINAWGKIRLTTPPEAQPTTATSVLQFEFIGSDDASDTLILPVLT